MSKIHFILGRTGTGKTHKILTEIINECEKNPVGDPIFIITPEQMTFHTEYQLLLMNKSNSMIRANAVSFNRLAYRIMQEVGGLSRFHLDEVGKGMLLQKIMMANSDLGIFSRYLKKPGFIQKLDELFSEFKNYQLDASYLKEKLFSTPLQLPAKQKISKLVEIYEKFVEATLKQYLTTEDYFTLLAEAIGQSELIKNAHIYIDGYHAFNAQEYTIIQKLAQNSKSIKIALTACENSKYELWSSIMATYNELKERLQHLRPTEERVNTTQFPRQQTITHLEKNFMQAGKASEETSHINLLRAPIRRLEIEEVAIKIHQIMRSQNIAFSNIAIYTSSPQEDQQLFKTIFAKHDIPYFLDYKEKMLIHPVINLLHKIFDIFTTNWNNNAVFTVLKTGLFVNVTQFAKTASYKHVTNKHFEDIDLLENYVLARNIRKTDWVSGTKWNYSKYQTSKQTDAELAFETKLNQIKQQVVLPILELEMKLKKTSSTTHIATAIFGFLEQLEIPKKLHLMASSANSLTNQKQAKQHEQVWTKLIQVLEQIVEVAGDEEIPLTDFIQIFKTGLEQLTFATVPPALDAVQIGDIIRSRYQLATNFNDYKYYGIKHVFIIGANDGVLPSIPAESSLLSEKEREVLASLDIGLAPSLMQSQQDEIFCLYTILSSAKESVTLSYSNENDVKPSYIFNHIQQLFPNIKVQEIGEDDLYDQSRLTSRKALFDKVLLNLKLNPNRQSYYEPILKYYERNDQVAYELIKRAASYENQVDAPSTKLTKELYGEEIEASVSRIELFNQCQFAHFMSYGLRLRERALFELTMPDIGSLYHEALKYISILVKNDNRSFASLSDSEVQNLAKMAVADTIKKYRAFAILESSARMGSLKTKLTSVVEKTLTALTRHSQRSEFKESYFELQFGKEISEAKLGIKTAARRIGSFNLSLKGIIDRIDTARVGERMYLRVVDYKSGKKELDLDTVYYGLSLQLLTYLDVAINGMSDNALGAGALYFHVHNPYTQINEEVLTTENPVMTVENEQSADYRMTGYLPENYEVAIMSDTYLADGASKSDVVPITLKKDQTFAARGNKILTPADFDMLRKFAGKKIDDAVYEMTAGRVRINPSSHKGSTACDWCQYLAVCKFDVVHNKYRNLPPVKADEALGRIKGLMGEDYCG